MKSIVIAALLGAMTFVDVHAVEITKRHHGPAGNDAEKAEALALKAGAKPDPDKEAKDQIKAEADIER